MFTDMPALSHTQQQQAVERIQELMAAGMSSGEAIALVAEELRRQHGGDNVTQNRWSEEDGAEDDE